MSGGAPVNAADPFAVVVEQLRLIQVEMQTGPLARRHACPDGGRRWRSAPPDGMAILDPENGKVYSAKMSLSDDGRKLNVRGFLGISLLGRTQTWMRE